MDDKKVEEKPVDPGMAKGATLANYLWLVETFETRRKAFPKQFAELKEEFKKRAEVVGDAIVREQKLNSIHGILGLPGCTELRSETDKTGSLDLYRQLGVWLLPPL